MGTLHSPPQFSTLLSTENHRTTVFINTCTVIKLLMIPDKAGDNKAKQGGASDRPVDVSMLNMRIGHIVNVKKHPDADTLYVEEVDVGEERNRTIVSGLVKHIPLEQVCKGTLCT